LSSRVLGTKGERKVGGCELFRRDEQRQRHVRDGLTKWADDVLDSARCRNEEADLWHRESDERFVKASAEGGCAAQPEAARSARCCGLMRDGVDGFGSSPGSQVLPGLRSHRASENQQVCALRSDLAGPWILFQIIRSEYHQGEQAVGAAPENTRRMLAWCGGCQPHKRRPLLRRRIKSNAMGSQPGNA
jgi:hypothetical protein